MGGLKDVPQLNNFEQGIEILKITSAILNFEWNWCKKALKSAVEGI